MLPTFKQLRQPNMCDKENYESPAERIINEIVNQLEYWRMKDVYKRTFRIEFNWRLSRATIIYGPKVSKITGVTCYRNDIHKIYRALKRSKKLGVSDLYESEPYLFVVECYWKRPI